MNNFQPNFFYPTPNQSATLHCYASAIAGLKWSGTEREMQKQSIHDIVHQIAKCLFLYRTAYLCELANHYSVIIPDHIKAVEKAHPDIPVLPIHRPEPPYGKYIPYESPDQFITQYDNIIALQLQKWFPQVMVDLSPEPEPSREYLAYLKATVSQTMVLPEHPDFTA